MRATEGKVLDTITVLVGNSESGSFDGFKAQFEGEEVASYKEGEDDKITCTLYRCEIHQGRSYYRVHEADEANSRSPRYELLPIRENGDVERGRYPDYGTYYEANEVLKRWPMFADALDILYERVI